MFAWLIAEVDPGQVSRLQQWVDRIPHPIIVGCFVVGAGAMAFTLASPLKSRVDQARRSKSLAARARSSRLRIGYGLMLLAGFTLTGLGTALSINGGQIAATAQARQAQGLLDQTRQENANARKEYQDKLQAVLIAQNAAKAEQTRLPPGLGEHAWPFRRSR